MKTVHEYFTNLRRMDGAIFVHSWFYSWMVSRFAGMVARGRMSEAERQVEGLVESMLSESFG